jgi:hypothetical protein
VSDLTVTIGIFDKEEEVLEGIRLIQKAGVDKDKIRVVVGNLEGAPLLSSSRDVHIEELYEIQETRWHDEDAPTIPLITPNFAGFTAGSTMSGGVPVIVPMSGFGLDDGPRSVEILQDIGIPDQAAEKCGKAIESGCFLLVTDADANINARTLLNHAGAADVFLG